MTESKFSNALEILLGGYIGDVKHHIIYRAFGHTNEDQTTIHKELDVKDKVVATCGSSGDQVLCSIFFGAKKAYLIDACDYAEPVTKLKIAAIKNLSFEDFHQFWHYSNILDHKFFAKLSHDLDPETQLFWDTIMLEVGNDNEIVDRLINQHSTTNKYARCCEFFTDKQKYYKLREKLNKAEVQYIQADLAEFSEKLGKVDVIELSNIFDYYSTTQYFQIIEDLAENNLNKGGKIQLYYDLSKYNSYPFEFNSAKYLDYYKIKKLTCIDFVGLPETTTQETLKALREEVNPKKNFVDLFKQRFANQDKKSLDQYSFTNTYILEKD